MAEIKDKKQYKAIKARIDQLFFETDEKTPADDPRLQELDILSALVEEYEKEHHAIEAPTLSETMNARLTESKFSSEDYKSKTHPNIRKIVFWDIDIDTLDWTLNKDFIINRVKERGNAKEINSINEYYDIKKDL